MKRHFLFAVFFCTFLYGFSQEWKWQNPLPQGNTLLDVHAFSPGRMIAVGEAGTIIETIDSGQTWKVHESGSSFQLNSVYFRDSITGWAVGAFGRILHTKNGGKNWFKQQERVKTSLHSVYFIDNQTGWAVGEGGVILSTKNGGEKWTFQNNGPRESLESVYFLNKKLVKAPPKLVSF